MSLSIKNIISLNDELGISWSDNQETYLKYSTLRDNCPCASCSGEHDIFGNKYIAPKKTKNQSSYTINKITKIGHYAIRIFWKDGHAEGLFTYDFLRKLK